MDNSHYDFVVIGAGPAGQKAAIQAAKAGKRVLVIDRERMPGGACVHNGTIPSKTLKETALALTTFRLRVGDTIDATLPPETQVASLMRRVDRVIEMYTETVAQQLKRNGVDFWRARASFVDARTIDAHRVDGTHERATGEVFVLAVGSSPRTPAEIPVDHEHILDSDSFLSMLYLPESLTVLGSGVIACEYASIFAALGVKVTMVDKWPRPLGFLDPELSEGFVAALHEAGGRFAGNSKLVGVAWNGLNAVEARLESGEVIRSDKMLCALGRVANLGGLNLAVAGVEPNANGLIDVDAKYRTKVPHIYAVGDVIGFPALASSAMAQGRAAACYALGIEPGERPEMLPVGVYSIPEIASVGLTEAQAKERYGGALIGRAKFAELARGLIARVESGLLKMVADASGRKLVGVQIVGDGATELIHLGQMALANDDDVDVFVEQVFNFPTLAEAYRVAALDITNRRPKL